MLPESAYERRTLKLKDDARDAPNSNKESLSNIQNLFEE